MPTDTSTSPPAGARVRTRDVLRDRAWVLGALSLAVLTFTTHVSNFAFTFLGANLLSPGDFATLTAMLGIVLVGLAPGMALQALTAAGVLGGPARIEDAVIRRLAAVIATLVVVTMVALAPLVGTGHPVSVVAIGTAAGLLPLTSANEGVLQGRGRFTLLGLALAASALCKLLVGVSGMALTSTVWAAAIGIATGYAVQLLVSTHMVTRSAPAVSSSSGAVPTQAPDGSALGRSIGLPGPVLSAVVMMGLLLVVVHVDAVMARILLDDQGAGLYAVGATGMRMVFWAPQFAVLLLYPILVTDPRRRVVAASMGALVGVGLVGVALAALVGPTVVPPIFGQEYAAIGSDLWRYAWLGTAAVGLQVLCLSDLATGRREMLWLLTGTVATIVATLLVVAPTTPVRVITIVATIATGFVVVGTVARMVHRDPVHRPPAT